MKNEMEKIKRPSQVPHNKSLFLPSHQSQTKQVQNQRQNQQVLKVVLWVVQMVVSHKQHQLLLQETVEREIQMPVTSTVGDKKVTPECD